MKYAIIVILAFSSFACFEKSSDRTDLNAGEVGSSNSFMEKCEKKSDCTNERDICFNKFCIDAGVTACQSGADCRTNESCSINAAEICDTCTGAICVPSQQCDANTDCQSGEISVSVSDMGYDSGPTFESDLGTD